ncbi:MAG: amidohydrolase [Deltaproteobacteria bacterium]|nr:amidohydrolase [Deltaproteobacteria bacterium]
MKKYRAVDADGHIMEHAMEIKKYLEPPYDRLTWTSYSMFPSVDGFVRGFSRPGAEDDPGPQQWLRFLDECGIEETYLYPSMGLAYGLIQDREWAVALGRAYNQWLHDKFMKASPRLKAVALIPIQDIPAAVSELHRAVKELGMAGAVLPAVTVLDRPYGNSDFSPIFEEAERLNCAIAIHGAVSQRLGIDSSDNLFKTIALEHPLAQIIQFTDMIADGIFERFPRLRVAFLESGAGWVPYMMDRLDEGYERRGKKWCKNLTKRPSEYVRGKNIFFSCEVEERTLPYVLDMVGEDAILFASDFPHERRREEFSGDIDVLLGRNDITEIQKEKILYHNAKRFYGGG